MVTHLLMDEGKANRVGGAVGFNVRTGDFYVFRAKAVIVCAGGASHIYKPRAVGEGMGRTWYAPVEQRLGPTRCRSSPAPR